MDDICPLCAPDEFPLPVRIDPHRHPECGVRMAIGGIGHLIAHSYWCIERHDPDAGLTYRQSALLVAAWVNVMGIESTAERSLRS